MLKVLIVDDLLIIRRQAKKIIENLGHKVVAEAKNAAEAVSMHDTLDVDLVTMDITMQGPDGITATKSIMEKNKGTKIIMITSHGREDMVMDAIKAGANGYILKPFTEESISESINKVFGLEDEEE